MSVLLVAREYIWINKIWGQTGAVLDDLFNSLIILQTTGLDSVKIRNKLDMKLYMKWK